MNNIIKCILSLVFIIGIGSLGGIFTITEIPNWYAGLNKPSFNPPNWLFGPVWTLLYTLMAISFYLIWKQVDSQQKKLAILFFMVQFILNFCWSMIFFKYHLIGWALVEILVMWIFILITIFHFWKLSKTAAILLWPYLFWVSFASILNAAIFKLN